MTNWIAGLLAKYFGPKFALQYAGTLTTFLQTNILAFLTYLGVSGAESHAEMAAKGLAGLTITLVQFFFTTKFDKAAIKKIEVLEKP